MNMTHFTVMVIGDDVDGLLEPYNENIETEERIDRTADEVHADFLNCKEEYLLRKKSGKELSDFQKYTLKLKKENPEWVEQWCGQEVDEDGNTLTNYNEDSKWDWYVIGGRWMGSLILKPGEEGELGERMFANKDMEIPDNRADCARKGQIDWEAMNQQAREQAGRDWDELFDPNPDHCEYRPEYVEEQRKKHLEMYKTKEEYVKRRGIWTPYAVLSDCGWHATGDMGYWGMSSDETEDRDRFDQEFIKLLAEYDDDEMITMVDCHI
jgi:hypothetical protein